jgi:Tfp pilus assembly protein PilF
MANWGFIPAGDAYPRARQASLRALSIDPSLAEAYASLATVKSSYEWKWKEADVDFQKAIRFNPNYATAHLWYSFSLLLQGRFDEALREIQIAQTLDPLSLIINANRGYTLYIARRYEEAKAAINKTLELDPNFAIAYEYLGYIQMKQGKYSQAVDVMRKAVMLAPGSTTFQADLASAHALNGEPDEAMNILNGLLNGDKYVTAYDIAAIYVALGDQENALNWLEKAFEIRTDQITYIKTEPRFDSLRNQPRFQALIRGLGF